MRSREPSPVEAAALADEVEQILRGLEPTERRMVVLRLQGYSIFEIAAETRCGERTVYRVLKRVRQQMEKWYRDSTCP